MALLRNYLRSRTATVQGRRRAFDGFILLLMAAIAAPAYGQATLFTNRQSFEAAVPNRTSLDFSSVIPFGQAFIEFIPPNPPQLDLDGVTFARVPQDLGGHDLSVLIPAFGTPYQGWNGNPTVFQYVGVPNSSLKISLPPGTLAVGFNFYTVQTNVLPAPPAPINVFTGNIQINLSTGQTFVVPSLDKPTLAFVGFTSATPITSLTILPPLASPTATANGYVDVASFSYGIAPAPTLSCPVGASIVNAAYASAFTATGGTPPYASFAITNGALPPGLTIDLTGHVAGKPTATGTFTFTGTVTDNFAQTGTADCSITIAPPPPITLSAVPISSSNGTQVLLTWNYDGGPIDGFSILRKPATLSSVLAPVTTETGAPPPGPQVCPPAVFASGILAPQSRCLIDTVPEAWATFTYQVQVSGGDQNLTPPSNKATAYQVRKTAGTGIDATFTPASGHSLQEAAQSLNYDHFNWISIISHDPVCYVNTPSRQLHGYDPNAPAGSIPGAGPAQLAPHLDPPTGGYAEYGLYPPSTNIGPSDGLPYYWDEQAQWVLFPANVLNPVFNIVGTAAGGLQNVSDTAKFKDTPFNSCLPGNGPPSSATEYWGFVTTLVGVRNSIGNVGGIGGTQVVNFTPLAAFAWNTTYNGAASGANAIRSLNLDAPQIAGTGGVFDVVDLGVQNLPLNLRQILIQAGAQGVSGAAGVDLSAPVTAAFLAGPQAGNGTYTGPVTVSLFATDVDGPSDVASTSYKIDGGATTSYAGPFTVSSSGAHTIVFGSVDQAQNVETPQPSVTFTIGSALPPLTITGPATLPAGAVGSLYTPKQFTATGGSGTGYTWTETGPLPMGLNFSASGLLSGTPLAGSPGTYNLQFKVTDSSNNTSTVSLSLTITSPSPSAPSITSTSPNPVLAAVGVQTIFINGSGFQNGAGLKVHLSSGAFQSDLTGAQVTFFSSTQLSIRADMGSTTASWTATVINPDSQSSNAFAFTVQAAQVTSFALPQFTFGGGWYSALYFANTTSFVAHVQVNFFGDGGAPLAVPLSGIGSVTSQSIDINPFSTAILEAPNSGSTNQEGWAEAALPTGVTGYAVFRQSAAGLPDQEAVVPLTPESSLTADLTYDDILFTTTVAFVNPTAQTLTVTINTFDATGSPNGTAQQVLNPRSKQAIALKSIPGLAGISGNRGRAVFSVPNGGVSVLGLRFGGSAFTSIPVVHRPATAETRTISFAFPQFVFGGTWYTALYFSNTTNATVAVPVTFIADTGAPLPVPLTGIGSVTSQTLSLAPGATAILEAPLSAPPSEGWVEAAVPPGVTGYAVFRQTVAGRLDQEAVVPLTSESSQTADLVFDDTNFTSAVAFLNPSDQQETVVITAFSAAGLQIASSQVALAPHAKVATVLKDLAGLSNISGNRGWATFSVANGEVSVLGLRFGGVAFTSIPVRHR